MHSLIRINRRKMRKVLARLGYKLRESDGITPGHEVYMDEFRTVRLSRGGGDPTPKELRDFFDNLGLSRLPHGVIKEILNLGGSKAKKVYLAAISPATNELRTSEPVSQVSDSSQLELGSFRKIR